MAPPFRILILCLILATGEGCARWGDDGNHGIKEFKFPVGRLALDSVGLEICVAQLDDSQNELLEECWGLLDHQEIDLAVRKQLDRNGLRVAVMASHAPATLHELLVPRPVEFENLDLVEKQMAAQGKLEPKPRIINHRRTSNRDGQALPIATSEIHPQLSWTVRDDQSQSVATGKLVRGVFSVTTHPLGDGTVRLKFTPEIHQGDLRPTIGVADRAFFMDKQQQITKLPELAFTVNVRAGETVFVAPTADVQDLGHLFFGTPQVQPDSNQLTLTGIDEVNHYTHRILMVRVVQTQIDDLFGNSAGSEKLTTTSHH